MRVLACGSMVAAAFAACTPAQAPAIRKTGMVMAIGGVACIVASALATRWTEHGDEMLLGSEIISATGIVTFAYAELTWPPGGPEETTTERHRRWAKILTGRAAGAAREGRCARVRRLEVRVNRYDREVHDFVFMRDPEIQRCLAAPPAAAPAVEPAAAETPGD